LPSSRLTVAGKILGTPNYMAPEQILSKGTDSRADLFSVAVVLYEFLTYVHPFQADLIPRRIVEGNPDSIFDHAPTLPRLFGPLFDRALAKNMEDRYSTGQELAADLRAIKETLGKDNPGTVVLPSERQGPRNVAVPATIGVLSPGPNDTQEKNLAQVMDLMARFEAKLQNQDLTGAWHVVEELESIAETDERFAETGRNCRARVQQIEAAGRPSATSTGVTQPPRPCPYCGTNNRRQAAYCIRCGAGLKEADETPTAAVATEPPNELDDSRLLEPETVPITQAAAAGGAPNSGTVSHTPVTPVAPTLPPAKSPRKSFFSSIPRKALVTGLLSGGGLLVFLVSSWALLSPSVQPWLASATVNAASSDIYPTAGRHDAPIAKLSQGTMVHLLDLPPTGAEWVHVQPMPSGKAAESGYVLTSDLVSWKGLKANDALAIVRAIAPPESASEEKWLAHARELEYVAATFSAEPAGSQARLDLTRLHILLARRKITAGMPQDRWEEHRARATTYLDAVTGAELQPIVEKLRAEIAGLQPLPAAPPTEATPPELEAPSATPPGEVVETVEILLTRARWYWDKGDQKGAERNVNKVLRREPNNSEAKELQNKIELKRKFDELTGKQ
ncbi:MAG TPA: hypothetical protein VEQ63_09445, partial [Bryobacteraceae bacterium]|nr:hypothetical protein [Bryobacteraceae bacterium]